MNCPRHVLTVTAALGIVLAAAGPASAHVEVSADGAQAGTGPVTLMFSAESESATIGIVSIKTQLPADTTELVFPTLQRYADGREDAWIEPVTQDIPNPEMPAPSLTVAPVPPEATAAPSTSAAPSSEAASSTTAQPQTAIDSAEDDSNTGTIAVVAGVLTVAAIGAGAWWWRSRRAG